MAPCISRAVIFDGVTVTMPNPRHSSAPTITTTNTNGNGNTTVTTSGNCCSGNHCQGCSCGCPTCSCRTIPVQDESNREVYGQQGGRPTPGPQVEMRNHLSPNNSSVGTVDTCSMDNQSFNNSWEVHDYLNAQLTAKNLARHDRANVHTDGTRHEYARSIMGDDDYDESNEHPWPNFISRVDSGPAMAEDSSGMILMGDMDDSSMFPEPGGCNSGDISILSGYEASFSRQSLTASQILRGAGAVFGT